VSFSRRTRVLRVPPSMPADILTSLDEGIREVIYGLDIIIQYLMQLTGRAPEQLVLLPPPPRVEVTAPPLAPAPQLVPMMPTRVVSLPYPVDIIGASTVNVTEAEYKVVQLDGDIVIVTADSDIYIAKRPNMDFPLWSNAYLIMPRSKDLNRLYIKSVMGSANAYLMFLAIGE
jgi:hypothetical protein